MSVSVEFGVNGDYVTSFRITRIKGRSTPNSVNVYKVVQQNWREAPKFPITFEHRYGDGIELCVERALAAVRAIKQTRIRTLASPESEQGDRG